MNNFKKLLAGIGESIGKFFEILRIIIIGVLLTVFCIAMIIFLMWAISRPVIWIIEAIKS